MKNSSSAGERPASESIDEAIAVLADWRGETLGRMGALILAADKNVIEERKLGIPMWSRDTILCTGETYEVTVKLTFAKVASLPDARSTSARAKP